MQLLEECFGILGSDDVNDLFGADNAWDVVDEVLIRYFDERLQSSPAAADGGDGPRGAALAVRQPHILETARGQFEALLMEIAEPAEEWLTSAQAMSLARRTGTDRVMPWEQLGQAGVAAPVRRAVAGADAARGPRRWTDLPAPQRPWHLPRRAGRCPRPATSITGDAAHGARRRPAVARHPAVRATFLARNPVRQRRPGAGRRRRPRGQMARGSGSAPTARPYRCGRPPADGTSSSGTGRHRRARRWW